MAPIVYDPDIHVVTEAEKAMMFANLMESGEVFTVVKEDQAHRFIVQLFAIENHIKHYIKKKYEPPSSNDSDEKYQSIMNDVTNTPNGDYRTHWELYQSSHNDTSTKWLTSLFFEIIEGGKNERHKV